VHPLRRHLLDCDDVGIGVELVRRLDHLRKAAGIVLHQHVGQQQRERLVADELARAPHRVPQPQRQLLACEARAAGSRQIARKKLEIVAPLALGERVLKLELAIEMILDHGLVDDRSRR